MRTEAALEGVRAALRLGVLGLLVLAPLPFGSVGPSAVLALEIGSACLGAASAYVVLRDPDSLPRRARLLLLAPGALVLVGLVQLVPLPASWGWLPVSGARGALAGLVPEASPSHAPWSVSPPDTVDAILRLLAFTLVGATTVVAFHGRQVRGIALAITAAGAFQGLYGAAEYLSGHQHIFGYAKKYYLQEATGTFINRNHFAGFLAMSLPFALGLTSMRRRRGGAHRSLRKGVLDWIGSGGPATILAGASALCMWLGVLLSYSRTGLAAATAATAVFLLLGRASIVRALVVAGVLLLPTLLLLWVEVRIPGERFGSLGTELASGAGRLAVWRTTLTLVAGHPVLGYGLGTFESAYAPHQTAAARGRYDHAHNDWLEAWTEGGMLAFLAVGTLLLCTLVPALRTAPGASRRVDSVRLAAAAGVVAIALHSLTDFCLRIPAVAVLLSILLGLLVRTVHDAVSEESGNVTRFRAARARPGGRDMAP